LGHFLLVSLLEKHLVRGGNCLQQQSSSSSSGGDGDQPKQRTTEARVVVVASHSHLQFVPAFEEIPLSKLQYQKRLGPGADFHAYG
jgi:hypothetical protein